MITVADVVVDGLARAGTPRIFGVPGVGTHLRLLDCLGTLVGLAVEDAF